MSLTPVPPSRSDAPTTVAAALAGDDEALGRLLMLHERGAYRIAYRLLRREADARDAVQEGFLRAVRAIKGGAPPREVDRFGPWLLRVVANAALDRLRRRTPFPRVSVDAVAHALPTPERLGPARQAERRESRADVLRALFALPRAQQLALSLREYQGLSYAEIATVLGVSHAAVEQLLFRARRAFREAYEGATAAAEPAGCPELAPLLSAMLDDELGAVPWRDLTAHLSRCSRCGRELQALRRMRRLHAVVPP